MALVEYGGRGHMNFIFILKDKGGMGWRKLAEALKEAGKGKEVLPICHHQ